MVTRRDNLVKSAFKGAPPFGRLVSADFAGHIDEPLRLLGIVGLGLWFARHADMVARRSNEGDGSLSDIHTVARHAAQFAGNDVPAPAVDSVDDASCRTDLPAEHDPDSGRDHKPGDHDGERDAHATHYCSLCGKPLVKGRPDDDIAIAILDQILASYRLHCVLSQSSPAHLESGKDRFRVLARHLYQAYQHIVMAARLLRPLGSNGANPGSAGSDRN